jgi:hypothetical protein
VTKHQNSSKGKIKTIPFQKRKSRVSIEDFAKVYEPSKEFSSFIENLPDIFIGKDFKNLVNAIVTACEKGKTILFLLGAHVIKCGLSPLLIDLCKRKILTYVAINGGGAIHDFEIAVFGKTSEDVEAGIKDGSFGMAEETGTWMNEAIQDGAQNEIGMGEALGKMIFEKQGPYTDQSLLATGVTLNQPVTVHVAIGTDIIHQHPRADGGAIGKTSFQDFQTLMERISSLEGGVVINIGSAVLLPEVFLKGLTIARNLGHSVKNFTAANLDMIQHYRPNQNIVLRPTTEGGTGIAITGHHEVLIPLLAAAVKAKLKS